MSETRKTAVLRVLRIAGVLLLICAVMSGLLAAVNALTSPVIAEQEKAAQNKALAAFFPAMAGEAEQLNYKDKQVSAVYAVSDASGARIGYCASVTVQSKYGGAMSMMIAFDADGVYQTARVLSSGETLLGKYTDAGGNYNGSDAGAGATCSYNAIREGITCGQRGVDAVRGGAQ